MPSWTPESRLLRSRIHEGWTLAALGVLLAEVAPNQLTSSADQVISIRSELDSLARVMRAHPYVQGSLDSGDLDAARSAAPMVGTAFDTVLSRIGHRGPGSVEVAASVIGDRPAAVLAAARRATAHGAASDHRTPRMPASPTTPRCDSPTNCVLLCGNSPADGSRRRSWPPRRTSTS